MAKKTTKTSGDGVIKQGSIAQFMRKRTQLVGFDFGLFKHTQYAIEFLDNSLDAIESYHWKMQKKNPENAFKLKDDVLLENFSYLKGGITYEDFEKFKAEDEEDQEEELIIEELLDLENDESEDERDENGGNGDITDENGSDIEEEDEDADEDDDLDISNGDEEGENNDNPENKTAEELDEEEERLKEKALKEQELEKEVLEIVQRVENFLKPIEPLIDREPFVIYRITEREAPDVYANMSNQSGEDVALYTMQIFDNGTGMTPEDLEKFGKYLASSKSMRLKQTRGSQGFGAPSAFSDAQNTTGQPIRVMSKHSSNVYAICSEFYTTSKNQKSYVVPPTEVECTFSHGTYIELNYLNVKYKRGYVDKYINRTALTNPHVTIIYLDPYGNEEIYIRKVNKFPREPTYAKPHPSSVTIGDFQDVLRNSEHQTITACLQENYVRMSPKIAKTIVEQAQEELERILKIINLDETKGPFITWAENRSEELFLIRTEQRVYGRSTKKRNIKIVYRIQDERDIERYWEIMDEYNRLYKEIDKLEGINKKENGKLKDDMSKKDKNAIKKKIKENEKKISSNKKEIKKLKKALKERIKDFKLEPDYELKDEKAVEKIKQKIKELLIIKTKPKNLTQRQTESLYKAFRSQNYLAPPKDPAVPIGATVLETTLMKEFNLSLSYRTDLFSDPDEELPKLRGEVAVRYVSRILSKFHSEPYYNADEKPYLEPLNGNEASFDIDDYAQAIIEFEILDQRFSEDFVVAETRKPTSGKGLAFVVEAAMAISPKIKETRRADQALMRYVNRTPKLRDNADCAIWKAVSEVNWKLYKLDTFDNGIPKGNLRLLVNVSGPYVHLMFKSQSKNALAEDKVLLKELKLCLQAIGRRIRAYQNKKHRRGKERKRSETIKKFIPIFINSLVNIARNIPEFKDLSQKELEQKLLDRLEGRIEIQEMVKKKIKQVKGELEEEQSIKTNRPEIKEEEPGGEKESVEAEQEEAPKKTLKIKIKKPESGDRGIASEASPTVESIEGGKEEITSQDEDLINKFLEQNPGKKAIWQGKETAAFKKWKEEYLKAKETEEEIPSDKGKTEEIGAKKAESSPLSKKLPLKQDTISIEERIKIAKEKSKQRIQQKSKIKTEERQVSQKNKTKSRKETITEKPQPSKQKASTKDATKTKAQTVLQGKQPTPQIKSESKKVSEPKKLRKPTSVSKSRILPTDKEILAAFEDGKWINIKELAKALKITNPNTVRFLQLELKKLSREGKISIKYQSGISLYKKR